MGSTSVIPAALIKVWSLSACRGLMLVKIEYPNGPLLEQYRLSNRSYRNQKLVEGLKMRFKIQEFRCDLRCHALVTDCHATMRLPILVSCARFQRPLIKFRCRKSL